MGRLDNGSCAARDGRRTGDTHGFVHRGLAGGGDALHDFRHCHRSCPQSSLNSPGKASVNGGAAPSGAQTRHSRSKRGK